MVVFLIAALLYTWPRRPPNVDKARYDFIKTHPGCTVDSVQRDGIDVLAISFRIRYREYASNDMQETQRRYQYIKGQGWRLQR